MPEITYHIESGLALSAAMDAARRCNEAARRQGLGADAMRFEAVPAPIYWGQFRWSLALVAAAQVDEEGQRRWGQIARRATAAAVASTRA